MRQSPRPDSTPGSTTAEGFVWVASTGAFNLLLRLAVMTTLARLLTPSEYGVVAAGMTVLVFVNLVGEIGLRPALVQRRDLTPLHITTAFTASLLAAAPLSAAVALGANVVEGFFRIEGLSTVVSTFAVALFLQLAAVTPRALLMRQMRFRALSGSDTFSYVAGYGAVSITLALLGYGYWSLAVGVLVQTALSAAIVLILSRRNLGLGFNPRAFMDLASTGVGFSITSVLNLLAVHADNVIVARLLGSHALGVYGRAYQLMALPVGVLTQVLDYVLFPVLSKRQDQPSRLADNLERNCGLTVLLALPATVLLALLAPELVDILFGRRWAEVAPVLQVLAWGTVFRLLYKFPSLMLFAMGRSKETAMAQLIHFLAIAGAASFAAPLGLSYVAGGVLLGLAVSSALTLYFAARAVSLGLDRLGRALVPGVLMALVVGVVTVMISAQIRPAGSSALTVAAVALGLASTAVFLLLEPVRRTFIGAPNLAAIAWLIGRGPRRG